MRILKDITKIKAELKQQQIKKQMKDKLEKFTKEKAKKSTITLRLSEETKAQLRAEAIEDGRSLASYILQKLKD